MASPIGVVVSIGSVTEERKAPCFSQTASARSKSLWSRT
jgi:hypothetical protein